MDTSRKKKIIITAAVIAAIAAVTALVFIFAWRPIFAFISDSSRVREFVDTHALLSYLVFLAISVLQIIVAVLPGEPVELAAGFAFGTVKGTILCLLGIFIGSSIIFLITRKFGRKFALLFIKEEDFDNIRFLKDSPKRDITMFLLMFIPGTPKDILSYFAGLTEIKMGRWLLICTFGRIPSVITSVIAADAIGSNKIVFAVVVYGLTAVASIIGLISYRKITSRGSAATEKEG